MFAIQYGHSIRSWRRSKSNNTETEGFSGKMVHEMSDFLHDFPQVQHICLHTAGFQGMICAFKFYERDVLFTACPADGLRIRGPGITGAVKGQVSMDK